MSEVGSKSHFLGQSDITQHFGVDDATHVDIVVYWPRFERKIILSNVTTNQKLEVVAPEKYVTILVQVFGMILEVSLTENKP